MIVRDRKWIEKNKGEPSEKMLKSCIKEHMAQIERMDKLDRYYKGDHEILKRKMKSEDTPNNKLVCNHARFISIISTSHMISEPIKYTASEKCAEPFQRVLDNFKKQDIAAVDNEIEKDCSIFGIGVEHVYMTSDEVPYPKSTQLDPRTAFVVYENTVERNRLFGIHYYRIMDEEGKDIGYRVNVITPEKHIVYEVEGDNIEDGEWERLEGDTINIFESVNMIEYLNNEEAFGDFEGEVSLMDAYNKLMSDRLNDKEAFVDAILWIKGQNFGDDFDETSETMKKLRELRLLELDEIGEAGYLTKSLNESEIEVLRRAIDEDIHRFSLVPNVADESFAGNASGVALAHKLTPLERLTKDKERYFRKSLRERLKLYSKVLSIQSEGFDVGEIDIEFTHSLPINQPEIAAIVSQLVGVVPDEDLYNLLWFIDDPQEAVDKMKEQRAERTAEAREALGGGWPPDRKQVADNEEE